MALARVNVSSGGRTPPVIVNVPTQSGTLTYSGSAKTPTWNGYDATQLLIGGTTSATNAGTYTATFTPQGNVTWSDGTSSPKSVTWTIAKLSLSVPAVTNTSFTYNGNNHSPTVGTYDSTRIAVTNTAKTDAGTYNVVFRLNDTVNCTWSDGTTADKTTTWTIAKATPVLTLSKTSISVGLDSTTTFTVTSPSNGALSVTSSSTGVATVTISGTTATVAGKGAGNATITVSQAAGTNYNAASATCTVSVAQAALNLSANISGAVTYNTTGTISISGNAGNGAITATSNNTNVIAVTNTSTNSVTVKAISGTGNATITISVAATANYAADSTTCTVTAAKATPTLTLSKTSGQLKKDETVTFTATSPSDGVLSVTSSNSNVATATVSGTTITVTGRGSGDATITVSQAATTNYTAKTATYFVAVAKEMPTLTLSETSGTATANNGTVNFTVTSNSTGAITVSSSDATIASVAKSGSTVTVTGKKTGSVTITVSQAATTDYAATSATYTVTVTKATPMLELTSLSKAVTANGTATFVITTQSNGALSVTSSNTSVATATISGKLVTVTGVSAGSATITVSLAESDVYEAATATCAVPVSKETPTLKLSAITRTITYGDTSTFTVTTPSDGRLSVSSSNSNVATASISDKTVTVTSKGVGSATITVSQASTADYNAPEPATCTVTIIKAKLAVPTVTNKTFTYDGKSHMPTIGDYDTALIKATASATTNAGEYSIVFALRDKTNTQWSSGNATEDKTVSWEITPAESECTPSRQTTAANPLEIKVGETKTITCTTSPSSGTIQVESNSPATRNGYVRATVSGKTTSITGVKTTSATPPYINVTFLPSSSNYDWSGFTTYVKVTES